MTVNALRDGDAGRTDVIVVETVRYALGFRRTPSTASGQTVLPNTQDVTAYDEPSDGSNIARQQ